VSAVLGVLGSPTCEPAFTCSLNSFLPAFLPPSLPSYLPACLPNCLPSYLPAFLPTCLPTYLPFCQHGTQPAYIGMIPTSSRGGLVPHSALTAPSLAMAEGGQTSFFGSLICTGPRQNPAQLRYKSMGPTKTIWSYSEG